MPSVRKVSRNARRGRPASQAEWYGTSNRERTIWRVSYRSFAIECADPAALRRRVERLCALSELCVDRSFRY
jgi:hypothetical protein